MAASFLPVLAQEDVTRAAQVSRVFMAFFFAWTLLLAVSLFPFAIPSMEVLSRRRIRLPTLVHLAPHQLELFWSLSGQSQG